MCGRYAASRNPDDLVEEFEIELTGAGLPGPSWNVAPTDPVAAVVSRPVRDAGSNLDSSVSSVSSNPDSNLSSNRDSGERTGPPRRQLLAMRWGLVPSWAKDPKGGARLINARVETAAEKPAFRKAYAVRRCLLPADGYYEWYVSETGAKQPFFISRGDGSSLALAGLYEIWRDPQAGPDAPRLWTATVLTTTATDELGHIHDRAPLLVAPEAWAQWLDPTLHEPQTVRALLAPALPGTLEARPVGAAVGNVRNNSPELVEPVPAAEGMLF